MSPQLTKVCGDFFPPVTSYTAESSVDTSWALLIHFNADTIYLQMVAIPKGGLLSPALQMPVTEL
jgi:hypothetical protein